MFNLNLVPVARIGDDLRSPGSGLDPDVRCLEPDLAAAGVKHDVAAGVKQDLASAAIQVDLAPAAIQVDLAAAAIQADVVAAAVKQDLTAAAVERHLGSAYLDAVPRKVDCAYTTDQGGLS